MSEAYERERQVFLAKQNNSRLDELSSKISALRGVTVDIYDNARNQDVLDSSVRLSPLQGSPSSTTKTVHLKESPSLHFDGALQ
ncbi:MAG: hypothetical protein Q9220_000553 [cf. Caloplaca sp. 1 TL-2023]